MTAAQDLALEAINLRVGMAASTARLIAQATGGDTAGALELIADNLDQIGDQLERMVSPPTVGAKA